MRKCLLCRSGDDAGREYLGQWVCHRCYGGKTTAEVEDAVREKVGHEYPDPREVEEDSEDAGEEIPEEDEAG